MKSTELMIGNLVNINGKQITMDSRIFHAVIHGFEGYSPEPIPLTEEWLLKFGFEEKGSFYRIKGSRFVEIISHGEGLDVCSQSILLSHIKHVHQLQNLFFALTNEQITIK